MNYNLFLLEPAVITGQNGAQNFTRKFLKQITLKVRPANGDFITINKEHFQVSCLRFLNGNPEVFVLKVNITNLDMDIEDENKPELLKKI